MMAVQPAMKKTMTIMKRYKYVTDDNDGDDHDYDYGDEDYYDSATLIMNSIHQASQLIYKYNASEALQM